VLVRESQLAVALESKYHRDGKRDLTTRRWFWLVAAVAEAKSCGAGILTEYSLTSLPLDAHGPCRRMLVRQPGMTFETIGHFRHKWLLALYVCEVCDR
jgi:hypothetical protein